MKIFHFGEKNFHQNNSQGKIAAYKVALKVNFEYADYMDKDEEVYRNIYSLTTLNKKLKLNSIVARDKGSWSSSLEPKSQEEEATRKPKEETTRRLAEGAGKLLAEEKQWEEEEEATRKENRKKEKAIQEKIANLERAITQEALNPEQEVQDQEGLTE